jgi:hypothetical protein
MNKELNNYIEFSRGNKVPDEDIKNNLLSKGWNIKDIEASFFVLSGGDKSQLKYSLEEEGSLKRKNTFSAISFSLFFITLLLYVLTLFVLKVPEILAGIAIILGVLLSFIGIVLGVIGVKSQRKVLASFGIFLNILMLLFIFFAIYLGYRAFKEKGVLPPESGIGAVPQR